MIVNDLVVYVFVSRLVYIWTWHPQSYLQRSNKHQFAVNEIAHADDLPAYNNVTVPSYLSSSLYSELKKVFIRGFISIIRFLLPVMSIMQAGPCGVGSPRMNGRGQQLTRFRLDENKPSWFVSRQISHTPKE